MKALFQFASHAKATQSHNQSAVLHSRRVLKLIDVIRLPVIVLSLLSSPCRADTTYGEDLLACLESKGVGMGKNFNQRKFNPAMSECKKSLDDQKTILVAYGDFKTTWLKCMQAAIPAEDEGVLDPLSVVTKSRRHCEKEYKPLGIMESAAGSNSDEDATALVDAHRRGEKIVISNPYRSQ